MIRETEKNDSLAPLEYGEDRLGAAVDALIEDSGAETGDEFSALFEQTVDAVLQAVGRQLDVDVDDLCFGDLADAPAAEALPIDLDALAAQPHALGWLHQHFGAPERRASHRAHNRREAKHPAQSTTTQLYTPRWVADALVGRAVEVAGDRMRGQEAALPTVLDPAVGGGQMLLAALSRLHAARPDASPATLVGNLAGCDIDERAVQVARRELKLHVTRLWGERDAEAEAVIDGRLQVGDGLFDAVAEELPGDPPDVVVTNPPYMGSRSMPGELKQQVRDRFEPYHGDLYAAFIRRCHGLAGEVVGVLAQQTIWYLKRFRRARADLLERGALTDFLHLGPHVFRSLTGEKANVVAFVQRSDGGAVERVEEKEGRPQPTRFVDLRDCDDASAKREALETGCESDNAVAPRVYHKHVDRLAELPGRPMAYWLPEALRRHFEDGRVLGDIAEVPGGQNKTGANRDYVREVTEVDPGRLHRAPLEVSPDLEGELERDELPEAARWVLYSKGGRYAPWWGNWQSVVDWSDAARAFYRDNGTSNLLAERYRFREGICYTDFGGSDFNARWMPPGCVFDMAGPAIFPHAAFLAQGPSPRHRLFELLAVLNSTPVRTLLNAMNPSIHYQVSDLRRLPLPTWERQTGEALAEHALALVDGWRALAAAHPVSPVQPSDLVAEAGGMRLAERERHLDRLVCEIFGWPEGHDRAARRRHRYWPDDA